MNTHIKRTRAGKPPEPVVSANIGYPNLNKNSLNRRTLYTIVEPIGNISSHISQNRQPSMLPNTTQSLNRRALYTIVEPTGNISSHISQNRQPSMLPNTTQSPNILNTSSYSTKPTKPIQVSANIGYANINKNSSLFHNLNKSMLPNTKQSPNSIIIDIDTLAPIVSPNINKNSQFKLFNNSKKSMLPNTKLKSNKIKDGIYTDITQMHQSLNSQDKLPSLNSPDKLPFNQLHPNVEEEKHHEPFLKRIMSRLTPGKQHQSLNSPDKLPLNQLHPNFKKYLKKDTKEYVEEEKHHEPLLKRIMSRLKTGKHKIAPSSEKEITETRKTFFQKMSDKFKLMAAKKPSSGGLVKKTPQKNNAKKKRNQSSTVRGLVKKTPQKKRNQSSTVRGLVKKIPQKKHAKKNRNQG